MPRIRFLLIPALLTLVPFVGTFVFPQPQRRRRLITGGLLFALIFSLLATGLQGSFHFLTLGWLQISLLGTPMGGLMAVFFAFLMALTAIFSFEVQSGDELRFSRGMLILAVGVQLGSCVGSLPLFLAAWLLAALAADDLVLHTRRDNGRHVARQAVWFRPATLVFAGVLLAGAVLTRLAGVPLTFLSHETPTGNILLPAALLLAGLIGHAFYCQHTAAQAPASIALWVIMAGLDLFGVVQVVYRLFGIPALLHTVFETVLPVIFLIGAVVTAGLSVRRKVLSQRLQLLAYSQTCLVLFGLLALRRQIFMGGCLLLLFSMVSMTALLLCSTTFAYTEGRTCTDELVGIGRQLVLPLFCFGCAAFVMVGLPPFAGSLALWNLAEGALSASPWGLVVVIPLICVSAAAAAALLTILRRGFFPGQDYQPTTKASFGVGVGFPLFVLTAALLLAGIFPQKILRWVQIAADLFG